MRPRQHSSARCARVTLCVTVAVPLASCASRTALRSTAPNPGRVNVSELWVDPGDIQNRDLFHGPGGPRLAPKEGATYALVAEDTSGFSRGYDVRDREGTAWSVKVGLEA